jgi:hypothetical protein
VNVDPSFERPPPGWYEWDSIQKVATGKRAVLAVLALRRGPMDELLAAIEAVRTRTVGNADMLRRLRADAVVQGFCMTCRVRRPRPGIKTCDVCLDRRKNAVRARRARGRCKCGAILRDRFRLCRRCRKARRAKDRRRQQRLIAAGRCLRHGNVPAVPGHVYCALCLDKLAETARVRVRAKKGGNVQPRRCSICDATDHNRARHDRDQTAVAAISLVPGACDLGVEAEIARPLGSE